MSTENTKAPHVYTAIAQVMAAMATAGIAKARTNEQQGFAFRGIDDVYNSLAAKLAATHLCIIPRVVSRTVTERATRNGGALFSVVVDVEYDIVSALDGSKHTARVCGEAMDSGDKASNKAMSAAYKYLALQTFCIPTVGDNDADATTHTNIVPVAPAAPAVKTVDPFDLGAAPARAAPPVAVAPAAPKRAPLGLVLQRVTLASTETLRVVHAHAAEQFGGDDLAKLRVAIDARAKQLRVPCRQPSPSVIGQRTRRRRPRCAPCLMDGDVVLPTLLQKSVELTIPNLLPQFRWRDKPSIEEASELPLPTRGTMCHHKVVDTSEVIVWRSIDLR